MQTIQTCGLSDDYKHVCFKDLEGYLNMLSKQHLNI